jgi:hypothetical protein
MPYIAQNEEQAKNGLAFYKEAAPAEFSHGIRVCGYPTHVLPPKVSNLMDAIDGFFEWWTVTPCHLVGDEPPAILELRNAVNALSLVKSVHPKTETTDQ